MENRTECNASHDVMDTRQMSLLDQICVFELTIHFYGNFYIHCIAALTKCIFPDTYIHRLGPRTSQLRLILPMSILVVPVAPGQIGSYLVVLLGMLENLHVDVCDRDALHVTPKPGNGACIGDAYLG